MSSIRKFEVFNLLASYLRARQGRLFVFTEVRRITAAAAGLWSPLNNFLAFQIFLSFLSFFKTIGVGIYQVHSRPNFQGRKGFSHQSDHRCLNGRRFIFVNFLKMGTWSVSQKRSGFRRFVGITYSATF